MSTDQQLKTRTPEPEQPPKASRLDLSVTKIVGGALAAMTAAALGSRLSVAGTVIGAAIASVVAAVGSTLYTASLAHTQEKVRTVFAGRVAGSDVPATVTVTTRPAEEQTETVVWADPIAPPEKTRRKLNWKSMLVGTVAAFGIAAVSLTGFELISGQALSGGDGTTITQVGSGNTNPTQTRTGQPSTSPSPTPTAEASESASAEPSASSSATSEPTPEPSASATSAAPSDSATETPSPSASQASPAPGASAAEGATPGQ
ncbi:MAG TPA: hypothetical protein VIT20_01190 [Propionibacteriaceae bacterium]